MFAGANLNTLKIETNVGAMKKSHSYDLLWFLRCDTTTWCSLSLALFLPKDRNHVENAMISRQDTSFPDMDDRPVLVQAVAALSVPCWVHICSSSNIVRLGQAVP